MARLHVIYDPTEKLNTHHPDLPKEIRIAVIDIQDNMSNDELELVINTLAELLLEQFIAVSND